jgi:hypothetical protein
MCEANYVGSISRATVQAPHTFRRFPCTSHTELSKARFSYFVEKVGGTCYLHATEWLCPLYSI